MNKSSIFFSIIISFAISLILVAISYGLLIKEDKKRSNYLLAKKYQPVIKMFAKNPKKTRENIIAQEFNLELINDEKNIQFILKNAQALHVFKGKHLKNKGFYKTFLLLNYKKQIYILIKNDEKTILFKDDTIYESELSFYITLAFILVFLVLIFSFIVTLKKLYAIKTLQKQVKILGDEEFENLPKLSEKKDEVSILTNEFIKSAKKLKNIKDARNVFIRNIMHELKTPITKGQFLVELDQNEQNKQKLKDIFYKLQILINEFALVESLSVTKVQKQKYYLDDIVENVEDLLLLDENVIDKKYTNIALHVSFKYFSIAIKNLVDNAIKYSSNKKVVILNDNANIIIKNQADPLPLPLQNYKEPFGGIQQACKNSFGLGLYIVFNILKANDYTLEYEHKNGENIFTCKAL